MRTKLPIASAVMLVVGVGLGYALAPRPATPPPKPASAPKHHAAKPLEDLGDTASLKARIRELETMLREQARQLETNAVREARNEPRDEGRHFNFRERMEQLKSVDPARYAQITNHMAKFRRRQSERQRARMEYLASIDTSHMSAAAKGVHKSLQNQIQRREDIEQQLQDENLTDDERRSLMDQLRESHRQIRALNGAERSNLLSETARVLGFEGQDAADLTTTIGEIIEATDNGFGGGGHDGPPPPGNSGNPPPNGGAPGGRH